MTSLRGLSINVAHERLASSSQPPSPTEEADISKVAWDDEDTRTLVHSANKGKGRERATADDADDDDTETLTGDSFKEPVAQYPPMTEEEFESKKVEENLKRWETLEKQRRKKARESHRSGSGPSTTTNTSTFSESLVSIKRASELFMSRDKANSMDRQNPHQVLANSDDLTPPERDTTLFSASPTSPDRTPRNSSVFQTDNPFENPDYAVVSGPSSISLNSPPRTPNLEEGSNAANDHHRKSKKKGKRTRLEPPRPLDLPPPITPLSAEDQRIQLEMEREQRRSKWWTEWMCGCREEGEEQAGRTNPME